MTAEMASEMSLENDKAKRPLAESIDKLDLIKELMTKCWLSGSFLLRSGKQSTRYFDKYLMESDPQILGRVCLQLSKLLPEETEVLAGVELGGVPLATGLSLQQSLPMALIRKDAKTYGTCKRVEGACVKARRVVIVEDVISTGGAVLATIESLRQEGAIVVGIVCVLKRDKAVTQLQGVPVVAVHIGG